MIEIISNRTLFYGESSLNKLPNLLSKRGKNHVFAVVFNQSADFVQKALDLLKKNGINCIIYDKITGEPDLFVIDQGVQLLRENQCDVVLAIGGGSVIDTAKSISLIATNGGTAEDYQMRDRQVNCEPLYLIAMPTTAGTGAEATKVSVIYNHNTGWKKSMYHNSMIAQAVILDPAAVMSLPAALKASTGIDALTHAIESYFSLSANQVSRMYSLKALALISANLYRAYSDRDDTDAHTGMLLGSYFSGCAIASGTGLAHIIGQPVGALYKIPHGDVCSILLPGSMRANAPYAAKQLYEISMTLGVPADNNQKKAIQQGIDIITELIRSVDGPQKLTDYTAPEQISIDEIIHGVQVSMGHIRNNPRPVEPEIIRTMIEEVL